MSDRLMPGTGIEIRNRFEGRWCGGFVVVGSGDDGYKVRRCSDGAVLGVTFNAEVVRPAPSLTGASR